MTATMAPELTVELRTRRDFTVTVQALEHRAEELEKLAKKNDDDGYTKEARAVRADVDTIKHFILPAFREQRELPLTTTEEVRAGIAEYLRSTVRGQLIVKTPADTIDVNIAEREQRILDDLAFKVETYAINAIEKAYAAGLAARESDPLHVAHAALALTQQSLL